MENAEKEQNQITDVKISKVKMFAKFARTIMYFLIGKRKWFMPGVSEITVDELNERINSNQSPLIIDVRDLEEYNGVEGSAKKLGHIPNAINLPIMKLSTNLKDLSSFQDKEIVTICPGGGMSLTAAEIMGKAGFNDVKSLTGGMYSWYNKGYSTVITENNDSSPDTLSSVSLERSKSSKETQPLDEIPVSAVNKTLDARDLNCPLPILKSKKALKRLKVNQVLEILTTDPGSWKDIPAWAKVSGHGVISAEETGPREYRFLVKKIAVS